MRRLPGIVFFAAALLAAAVSCSDGPKVIPVRKMEKIYQEMFLADQWLADFPEKKEAAETTWFYEPVFEKYGYDVEDYRKSVDYYLNDPKRYSEMLGRVAEDMRQESARLHKILDRQERQKEKADSIARALKAFAPEDFILYEDLFLTPNMTDRINIRKNRRGVYFPVPVTEDTVFRGPEMIVRDSLEAEPEQTQGGIPWVD